MILIGLLGVIIGSIFGVLGTIINTIWLEPEKKELERENEEKRLRKALYGELLSIANGIASRLEACELDIRRGGQTYATSTDKLKSVGQVLFRVYLRTDPTSFFQLEDAAEIEEAYAYLDIDNNTLEEFRHTSFDVEAALEKCKEMRESIQSSFNVIDRVFEKNKLILQRSDGENLLERWSTQKSVFEAIWRDRAKSQE